MADGKGNWSFASEVHNGRIQDTRRDLPGFEREEPPEPEKVKKTTSEEVLLAKRSRAAKRRAEKKEAGQAQAEFQALKLKLKQEGKLL